MSNEKSKGRSEGRVKLPHHLTRRFIYILPTRQGLIFVLILFGMLVGSINYNNNLGFLLTFLLGSMAFISIIHTFRNLSGIQIVSAEASPVFAGQTAEFQLIVRAPFHSRLAVSFKFAEEPYARIDIETNRDNQVLLKHATHDRGVLYPRRLTIFSRYPLGLFYAWSYLHLESGCVVYPKPIRAQFQISRQSGENGVHETLSHQPGVDDFDGLRAYQPGDALQHISWKTYSRGLGLMTKQFIGVVGTSPVLDWDSLRPIPTERRLSMLCDLVLQASQMNLVFGLKLPSSTIPPDKGQVHKRHCLQALALYEPPEVDTTETRFSQQTSSLK